MTETTSTPETTSDSDRQPLLAPRNQQQEGSEGNGLNSLEQMKKKWRRRRAIEWVVRGTVLGACIAATVVTHGVAAPMFVIVPMIEPWAQERKQKDKKQKNELNSYIGTSKDGSVARR